MESYGDLNIIINGELDDFEILGFQTYFLLAVVGDDKYPALSKIVVDRGATFRDKGDLMQLLSELCGLGNKNIKDSQACGLIFGLIDRIVFVMTHGYELQFWWD